VLAAKKKEGPLPKPNRLPDADPLPPSSRALQSFAQKLVDFIFASPDFPADDKFDGIAFDIEGVTSTGGGALTDRAVIFAELYQRIAALLAQGNRLCAIATGALASPTTQRKPPRTDAPQPNGIVHPFELALGAKNIIMRPMAYEGYDNDLLAWHGEITEYALSDFNGTGLPRLHPSQFQLGVKTTSAGHGVIKNPSDLFSRCDTLFRNNRIGFCIFALSSPGLFLGTIGRTGGDTTAADLVECNNRLNPGEPKAGERAGMPLQVPLNDGDIARFDRAPVLNQRDRAGADADAAEKQQASAEASSRRSQKEADEAVTLAKQHNKPAAQQRLRQAQADADAAQKAAAAADLAVADAEKALTDARQSATTQASKEALAEVQQQLDRARAAASAAHVAADEATATVKAAGDLIAQTP